MKRTIKIASPFPVYIATGCIIVAGLILPLYKLWGIALVAVLSIAAYFIAKRFFPDRVEQIDTVPEYRTGIAELDEALINASTHMKELRILETQISDARVKAAVSRMVKAGEAILEELNEKPDKTFSMRRFLTYYLPTSRKLMESYKKQEQIGYSGDNIEEIMNAVEANSETIARAFENSLDSLYAGEAVDITSDIDVLDSMVNSEL